MTEFKAGDLVRTAGYLTSGKIRSVFRLRGIWFADVDTGEMYNRRIPLDQLRLIEHCDYSEWIRNISGEVVTAPCRNRPEIPMNGGYWLCGTCYRDRRKARKARKNEA